MTDRAFMAGPGWELHRADSLIWLRERADNSVDAIITDPPYSSGGQHRGDRTAPTREKYQRSDSSLEFPDFYGDTRDQRAYLSWCSLWLADAWRVTRDNGVIGVFIDWRMLPTMTDAIQCGGWVWRGIVPWVKPNARRQIGRFAAQCEFLLWGSKGPLPIERDVGALPGFFQCNSVPGEDRQHQTEKPETVMREILKFTAPDGLVCDPFVGSGTTAVAALREGRRFVGVEMGAEYFEIAIGRVQALENLEHRSAHRSGQIGLFAQPKEQTET